LKVSVTQCIGKQQLFIVRKGHLIHSVRETNVRVCGASAQTQSNQSPPAPVLFPKHSEPSGN